MSLLNDYAIFHRPGGGAKVAPGTEMSAPVAYTEFAECFGDRIELPSYCLGISAVSLEKGNLMGLRSGG